MIIQKKIVFNGLFHNSWKIEKLNTVIKHKTKKNTLSEGNFSCKNKCARSSTLSFRSRMKKIWEKDIFSMKKWFEEIRVTHIESRGKSQRKHTLNKNLYYI